VDKRKRGSLDVERKRTKVDFRKRRAGSLWGRPEGVDRALEV